MSDVSRKGSARQLELPVSEGSGWRAAASIVNASWFKNFILACIVANAISLGMDAHLGDQNPLHQTLSNLDLYFLAIFTAEIILKLLACGPRGFLRDPWNVFDSLVVVLSYVATMPFISALRTLRVLRVLRLVSAVPQMRRVVEALFGAMPGILASLAVLAVVFYISAVMATTLFGSTHDAFADLGASAITLFQLSQFDGWGEMVVDLNGTYPWAWAFMIGFTVIAAFAVLNLFIGVIVDAVQETRDAVTQGIADDVQEIEREVEDIEEGVQDITEAQDRAAVERAQILDELRGLREQIAALRTGLGQ